jgi:hypothetical protein
MVMCLLALQLLAVHLNYVFAPQRHFALRGQHSLRVNLLQLLLQ